MRAAAYIGVDSDAELAMQWIFESGLAVAGTIIGYAKFFNTCEAATCFLHFFEVLFQQWGWHLQL
jgi:hypothetical protein